MFGDRFDDRVHDVAWPDSGVYLVVGTYSVLFALSRSKRRQCSCASDIRHLPNAIPTVSVPDTGVLAQDV